MHIKIYILHDVETRGWDTSQIFSDQVEINNLKNGGHHQRTSLPCQRMGVPSIGGRALQQHGVPGSDWLPQDKYIMEL